MTEKMQKSFVGERVKDFSLASHEGKSVSVQGKNAVLVFYCMNDTPG